MSKQHPTDRERQAQTESLLGLRLPKTTHEHKPERIGGNWEPSTSMGNGRPRYRLHEMSLITTGTNRVESRDRTIALAPNFGREFCYPVEVALTGTVSPLTQVE